MGFDLEELGGELNGNSDQKFSIWDSRSFFFILSDGYFFGLFKAE